MRSATNAALEQGRIELAELNSLHQYVDTAFHARLNLLLVAETLFLAALSQVWKEGGTFFHALLCVLGFVVTLVFGRSLETLQRRSKALARERKRRNRIYAMYLNAIPEAATQTRNLATFLPDIFCAAWGLLLLAVIARQVLPCPPAWLGG